MLEAAFLTLEKRECFGSLGGRSSGYISGMLHPEAQGGDRHWPFWVRGLTSWYVAQWRVEGPSLQGGMLFQEEFQRSFLHPASYFLSITQLTVFFFLFKGAALISAPDVRNHIIGICLKFWLLPFFHRVCSRCVLLSLGFYHTALEKDQNAYS